MVASGAAAAGHVQGGAGGVLVRQRGAVLWPGRCALPPLMCAPQGPDFMAISFLAFERRIPPPPNHQGFVPSPPPPPQGCIRREGTSEAAPEAVRRAVGGGCQSGWGRLLSVTNAVEAGIWCQGDNGWALAGRPGSPPPLSNASLPPPPPHATSARPWQDTLLNDALESCPICCFGAGTPPPNPDFIGGGKMKISNVDLGHFWCTNFRVPAPPPPQSQPPRPCANPPPPQGCIRTAVHPRRRGGVPPLEPPLPPSSPSNV